MHSKYRHAAIREIRDEEIRFSPRDRKLAVAARAEDYAMEVEPEGWYCFTDLHCRLRNAPTHCHTVLTLSGKDVRHDLQLLIEDLSESAAVPSDAAGQPVLTVAELAKDLNVSSKTISRWRRLGLVSRKFVFAGRKRLGFLQSSVDKFVEFNRIRVVRGSHFSQLSDDERREIIDRARQWAAQGKGPAAVTKLLSQETGRSAETVRYTLRQFDQAHPDDAVFPEYHGPMKEETRWRIYQFYRRGESLASLAQRFYRTKKGIRRIVLEMRARQIGELPLTYIHQDEFDAVQSAGDDREILRSLPRRREEKRAVRVPAGLPAYLASLYKVPLLTRDQETHLFRKMNYLKYRASQLREKLDRGRPSASLMERIEKYYEEALVTKNQIIRANLRLVVSIAKRRVGAAENFFELVSDGHMSLIRAVEKFDFARGNKFSTYASWAIMKNFARSIPDEHRHQDRFRTSHSDMFMATEDPRSSQFDQENAQQRREAQVERILAELDKREKEIVIRRFGLDRRQNPLTLKQVGAELGVTKERIRQLEARALKKLRRAAELARIEFPVC
jgi:RNA polymerase primary sigma factor